MERRKIITRFWAITAAFLLMFSSVAPTFAYSNSDLKENQSKQSEVAEEQSEIQSQIDDIKAQQAEVNGQVNNLSSDAAAAEAQVNEITLQIQEIERQITALEDSIVDLEQEIAERHEIIQGRMVAVQESGGQQTYMEVIFGATSFGNFIERTTTISTIIKSDLELIEEQEAAIEELEYAKTEAQVILEDLNATKAVLEEEQRKIEEELNKELATAEELEQESDHFEEAAMSLEEEQANLEAQERVIKDAMNGGSPPPQVSVSGFINPCEGYMTSGYGSRSGGFHYGIDIVNHVTETATPIYASADGVVTRSYYSDSYGNCVMIWHNTPSGGVTTVYAHMSSRLVSEGDTVKQGQQIGTMGATGATDDVHLHYEVHEGEWNDSKSNSVDPIGSGYADY